MKIMPEDPEHSQLIDQAIATGPADGKPDRYISSIVSTCRFCGYEEAIEIPELATPEDIIQALMVMLAPCPECQERLSRDIAEIELAEYGTNEEF